MAAERSAVNETELPAAADATPHASPKQEAAAALPDAAPATIKGHEQPPVAVKFPSGAQPSAAARSPIDLAPVEMPAWAAAARPSLASAGVSAIAPQPADAATPTIAVAPAHVEADLSVAKALDLAAIFPPAGAAPLTVAFARPAPAAAAASGPALPEADAAERIDTPEPLPTVPATAAPAPAAPLVAAAAPADGMPAPAISPELSVQHHLDVAHDGVWLDRLARDIAASADHESRMRFQLNPERLGALQVEIRPGVDGAAVRFTAESEAARTLIADAQPKLIADARAHGMKIAETHVEIGRAHV